jgi:hypothetical protein
MSVLCMETLTLGQDINECLVHGELVLMTGHKSRHYFMSCAKGKFSMHKALIYVLS